MTEYQPRKGFSKGLGRGLSALLAEDPDDQLALDRMRPAQVVPVENLVANRYQPRQRFDRDELQALTESVKANGILMPILVRRLGDGKNYEIVAGERRWRAAQEAQLYEVPVVVKELDDKQALEMALVENIQRQDLTPLEEAEGYRRLIKDFGHTQEDVAQVSGKSRSHVANFLRLLGLPDIVKNMVENGRLTAGHARALLSAEQPAILAEQVVGQGLNVRQTELLVKQPRYTDTDRVVSGGSSEEPNTRALERQLSDKLGLRVKIKHHGERGEVRIGFASLEQFDDILKRLGDRPNNL